MDEIVHWTGMTVTVTVTVTPSLLCVNVRRSPSRRREKGGFEMMMMIDFMKPNHGIKKERI
jgi:hypothetical protein